MANFPLKDKIRTQAGAYAPLVALLGPLPTMRLWNVQLKNGAAFPAVVVTIVSDPQQYSYSAPLKGSYTRVSFVIWDTNPDRLETVDATLQDFLKQFNGDGVTGLVQKSNLVLNRRDGFFPDPQAPKYQRFIDVKVFNNASVS